MAYQQTHQLPQAYNTFAQAIEIVEQIPGAIVSGEDASPQLAEKWHTLYRRMVEVCLALGRYTEALKYVERSKTRTLFELLTIHDFYPKGEIPLEIQTHLGEASAE
uniref:Tetratricopeptide repeat protein n=1 Tax=Desertifilum tharense IPPAS B-1220 TaxID=1781255 RepID=A0ACD5GYC1_9CYAN